MVTNPTPIILSIVAGYIVIFIVIAIIFRKPPKFRSLFYGYRSPLSMKNKKNWDFANHLAPKLMLRFTAISFLISLIIWFATNLDIHKKFSIIIGLLGASVILSIVAIEYLTYKNERK